MKFYFSRPFFMETKLGKGILVGGVIVVTLVFMLIFFSSNKESGKGAENGKSGVVSATKATTHSFSSNIDPIEPQNSSSGTIQHDEPNTMLSSILPNGIVAPCPMKIYAAPPSDEVTISDAYLPYGCLIKCALVNTVDSSRIATPIIGMVTEDVWQAGICVISAGTQVHGIAQVDRSRERIASEKEWIVVWQDGKELPVKGIALSNTQHGREQRWSITDGSAGLEGEILKSDKLAQLKEILATTVSAAGSGLVPVTTTTSPLGNTQVSTTGSAQAVLGESIQAVGRVYAEQIMQSIQRDGWFVRCKAGSSFYLYTLETVDISNAHVGSSRSKEKKLTSN